MFRATSFVLAPLAVLAPVLADSIAYQQEVKRFVGDNSRRTPNAGAINSLLAKTKGDGKIGIAACLGKASLFARSSNPSMALSEIERIFPYIQEPHLKRLAIGIRIQARNKLLDISEAALSVSGETTESEVSSLRSTLSEDYALFRKASPNCFLVEIAAAEYSLYEGKTKEAYNSFLHIEKSLSEYINTPIRVSSEMASNANTHIASLFAFYLEREYNSGNVKANVGANLKEAFERICKDPRTKGILEAFKKDIGENLTDEEAIELALILQKAEINHHFHDFFPLESEYDDWASPRAQEAKGMIQHVCSPNSAAVSHKLFDDVRKTIPSEPFYVDKSLLVDALSKAPKGKTFVAHLRDELGQGPQSVLSKSDEPYFNAIKALDLCTPSAHMAGSPEYAYSQKQIAKKLAQQLLYRTQVNKAVALTEMKEIQKAIGITELVIVADEFVHMWRAFMARGRAYKALGMITQSDKDFKTLNKLKHTITSDTPYEKC